MAKKDIKPVETVDAPSEDESLKDKIIDAAEDVVDAVAQAAVDAVSRKAKKALDKMVDVLTQRWGMTRSEAIAHLKEKEDENKENEKRAKEFADEEAKVITANKKKAEKDADKKDKS